MCVLCVFPSRILILIYASRRRTASKLRCLCLEFGVCVCVSVFFLNIHSLDGKFSLCGHRVRLCANARQNKNAEQNWFGRRRRRRLHLRLLSNAHLFESNR